MFKALCNCHFTLHKPGLLFLLHQIPSYFTARILLPASLLYPPAISFSNMAAKLWTSLSPYRVTSWEIFNTWLVPG